MTSANLGIEYAEQILPALVRSDLFVKNMRMFSPQLLAAVTCPKGIGTSVIEGEIEELESQLQAAIENEDFDTAGILSIVKM